MFNEIHSRDGWRSRTRQLTDQIHFEGQALVWVGPQEQAELYHQQLKRAGLTMAPSRTSLVPVCSKLAIRNKLTGAIGRSP